ncbi:MAG: cupredoxin domain-containing protein [Candidatus Micrarchaeia archaeon]|jgi:plastocyanin
MKNLEYIGMALIPVFTVGVAYVAWGANAQGAPPYTQTSQQGSTQISVYSSPGAATAAPATGKVQVVKLAYKDGIYDPQTIRTRIGTTIRMEVDTNTLCGCMTTVTVPAFGVFKHISEGDNVIEFTASKAGEFRFSCPMGMGGGKLLVEDENGNVPANADSSAGRVCGGGCGGCGGGSGGCGQ